MARCLELARGGQGKTSPNPMVGCVIADGRGRVVAEGFHRRLGAPHAEADALAKIGGRAPGGTLYVNLEPCRHRSHRRTEPCAPRVLEAGIARLVIGMKDPFRSHGGGGAWLARNGIEVVHGVREAECRALNRAFIVWAKRGRPMFVLKAAVTLDGRVATRAGQSQWITGAKARRDGRAMRARLDAIAVGVKTVLADDPQLTARGVRGPDPVRIVLDSRLRTPATARVLPVNSASKARVILACTTKAIGSRERVLTAAGAEVWRVPGRGKRVDLGRLAAMLAAQEIASVLVEGGATVHGAMLDAGLADEIVLYMAPLTVGGVGAPSWAGGRGVAALGDAGQFEFVGPPRQVGSDLVVLARRRGLLTRSGT